jgi:hypothetical protein
MKKWIEGNPRRKPQYIEDEDEAFYQRRDYLRSFQLRSLEKN